MYIQGKFKTLKDDLTDVFEIRRKVFVEEQNIPEKIEFDDWDSKALFCVVYELGAKNQSVATGRLIWLSDTQCKIGRIAVLREYRRQSYGDMVVKMLVNKAFMEGAKEVIVEAQIQAVDFYKKIGFVVTGTPFVEADIERVKMTLTPGQACTKCQQHTEN